MVNSNTAETLSAMRKQVSEISLQMQAKLDATKQTAAEEVAQLKARLYEAQQTAADEAAALRKKVKLYLCCNSFLIVAVPAQQILCAFLMGSHGCTTDN